MKRLVGWCVAFVVVAGLSIAFGIVNDRLSVIVAQYPVGAHCASMQAPLSGVCSGAFQRQQAGSPTKPDRKQSGGAGVSINQADKTVSHTPERMAEGLPAPHK